MVHWFSQRAPLQAKLDIAFGALSILVAIGGGLSVGECIQLIRSPGTASAEGLQEAAAVVIASYGVLFIASVAIGRLVGRVAASPITALAARLEALASGDIHAPIDFAHHQDDAGRLSQAMHLLRASVAEDHRLKADYESRGKAIAVLLDSYCALVERKRSSGEALGPRLRHEAVTALDGVEAALTGPETGRERDDLRDLLIRLGRSRQANGYGAWLGAA